MEEQSCNVDSLYGDSIPQQANASAIAVAAAVAASQQMVSYRFSLSLH